MAEKTFASLVKNNNGFFKSDAQAFFLANACQEPNQYASSGAAYGHSYVLFYICDSLGVAKVQKQTSKGLAVIWERRTDDRVSIQDKKELQRLRRLIKETEQSIAKRIQSRASGSYPDAVLFNESQERDGVILNNLHQAYDCLSALA
jgi:hypothetical protein